MSSEPIKIEIVEQPEPLKLSGSFVPRDLDFITVGVNGMPPPKSLDISISGTAKVVGATGCKE
jgi:hypothetical protein